MDDEKPEPEEQPEEQPEKPPEQVAEEQPTNEGVGVLENGRGQPQGPYDHWLYHEDWL
jgi:hypothetical protein